MYSTCHSDMAGQTAELLASLAESASLIPLTDSACNDHAAMLAALITAADISAVH